VRVTRRRRAEHGFRGRGESDSGASPAGAREVGDDRWGPPVIGRARGGGEVGWRRRLVGPKGQAGRRSRRRWAARRPRRGGGLLAAGSLRGWRAGSR
jgi:hypothetical protein